MQLSLRELIQFFDYGLKWLTRFDRLLVQSEGFPRHIGQDVLIDITGSRFDCAALDGDHLCEWPAGDAGEREGIGVSAYSVPTFSNDPSGRGTTIRNAVVCMQCVHEHETWSAGEPGSRGKGEAGRTGSDGVAVRLSVSGSGEREQRDDGPAYGDHDDGDDDEGEEGGYKSWEKGKTERHSVCAATCSIT